MKCVILLLIAFAWLYRDVSAQTAPLVVESITDLGRFSEPPTNEALAAGAMVTFGSGSATDAAMNPAALMRGRGADLIVAGVNLRTSREAFLRSAALTPGATSPEREIVAGPWTQGVFVGAAVRRRIWAAAGFYDGATRLRHEFSTDQRILSQISSPGGVVFSRTSGTTESSIDVTLSRVGGAVAVMPFGRWLSVGGSIEAVKLNVLAKSGSNLEVISVIRPQPPVTSSVIHTSAFVAKQWKTGMTLSATFTPVRPFTISVVQRWAPTFAAELFGESRNVNSGFVQSFDQRLTINAPDLFVVGTTFTAAGTTLGFEIARVDYRMLPEGALVSPRGVVLQSPAPAIEPRAAVRQVIGVTQSRQLAFGAGVWREGIHALSSNVADPFVPVAQRRTWLTGGVSLELERLTFGVAIGVARDERRVAASVGIRRR